MESFYDILKKENWQTTHEAIMAKTTSDVERALAKDRISLDDFQALISPAGKPFLDAMAVKAQLVTQRRFGKNIQLYIPLYLSNYCTNYCLYCGFSCQNQIPRKKLTIDEVLSEVEVIKSWGFEHLLLVSGEADRVADASYYEAVLEVLCPHFAQMSLEVQPLKTEEYQRLSQRGVSFVAVYQETYHEDAYRHFHPRGKKSDFRYRLETPERCATGGVAKVGIGALLGLQQWRADAFFTALHLSYLEKRFWQMRFSLSLPRLRPEVGGFTPEDPITDSEMIQLIMAFRLFNPEVDISLSTRECAKFRDIAMKVGVTTMSAASSTEPGGYATHNRELEQFAISDNRTVEEIVQSIKANGYFPVWKDWDRWL